MAVNDRTASSRQLSARWSTATGVLESTSSIRRRLLHRGLRARSPLYRIPLTENHRRLRLQWILDHRAWQADWHQFIFLDESRFNLWHHDGRIRVRRYAGERCFPECVIVRHSGLTPGIIDWGAISYHGRSDLLLIEGNLNSNSEVLQPEVVPFLQVILGAIFQQDNTRPHIEKNYLTSVQPNKWNFFLGLFIRRIYRLLSWCGIWLIGVLLVIRVLQLQKTTFAAHTSNMEFSSTSRHSKAV
ncbi:transposable element Tc1 transposase [Trichonephila clavipes]|nr:transposable element Tc1 transposase [Trichonephila clavipes]